MGRSLKSLHVQPCKLAAYMSERSCLWAVNAQARLGPRAGEHLETAA
jgi:hypothetical protein